MAVPIVDKKLLRDLEAMGFPLAQATNAIHQSGNSSLEDAIKWIIKHETDLKIDEMPLVPVEIATLESDNFLSRHAVERNADESSKGYLKRKCHEETQMTCKKAKVREWRETLQVVEGRPETPEIQVESNVDSQNRANDEAEKARATTLRKLEEDMHRQLNLGLPSKNHADAERAHTMKLGNATSEKSTKKVEHLRDCLRSIKGNHQAYDGEVKTAFCTLLTYVRNVLKNPNEEKFKRIRVANPNFRSRVGHIRGGIEFLQLCGFEWTEDGDYLHLPRNKVDPALLSAAGSVLDSALTNRFFGLLFKGKVEMGIYDQELSLCSYAGLMASSSSSA